jgi:hypothetical protein
MTSQISLMFFSNMPTVFGFVNITPADTALIAKLAQVAHIRSAPRMLNGST